MTRKTSNKKGIVKPKKQPKKAIKKPVKKTPAKKSNLNAPIQNSKKKMNTPLRKNVSQSVMNGTILQTRDEYLHKEGDYRKPGYEKRGNYRKVAVVDSNRHDELAIVKLYSKSGKELPSKKSRYKPFVETLDKDNKRIKIGGKFIPNGQKLTQEDVTAIKIDSFSSPKVRHKNKKKVRRIKGRK